MLNSRTALDTRLLAMLLCAPALAQAMPRTGTDGAGTAGPESMVWSSISADGRCATFASAETNLVERDTNGFADVFVYDGETDVTSRVSVATDGTQGDGESFDPSISADGRYIEFWSWASNLDPDDTNGFPDCFVHDRRDCTTRRLSAAEVRVFELERTYYPGENCIVTHECSLAPGGGWVWTDSLDGSSNAPLFARGSEHASEFDGPNPLPQSLGPTPPADFELTTPFDGAITIGVSPFPITLSWAASSDQDSYSVEIADDPSFAALAFSYPVDANTTSQDLQVVSLQYDHLYYWRVLAINSAGTTVASNAPFEFTMSMPVGIGGGPDTMGFCFVATAAYGSAMEPEVATLRSFRERVLMPTSPGRTFVAWYYRNSPPLAAAIAERPSWRSIARAVLWPVVGTARAALWAQGDPLAAVGLAGAAVAFGSLVAWFVRRHRSMRAGVRFGLAGR